jgi:hypothetical protein
MEGLKSHRLSMTSNLNTAVSTAIIPIGPLLETLSATKLAENPLKFPELKEKPTSRE